MPLSIESRTEPPAVTAKRDEGLIEPPLVSEPSPHPLHTRNQLPWARVPRRDYGTGRTDARLLGTSPIPIRNRARDAHEPGSHHQSAKRTAFSKPSHETDGSSSEMGGYSWEIEDESTSLASNQ